MWATTSVAPTGLFHARLAEQGGDGQNPGQAQVLCGKAEYLANAPVNLGGREPRPEFADLAHGSAAIGNAESRRRRFAAWLATPAGTRLLASERPLVQEAVRRFHGDSLLWVGASAELVDTTWQCMVRARMFASLDVSEPALERSDEVNVVVVDPIELPFASGSIDGVVLHHAVDLVADRRGTLREVARVLKSGGRLVVVGFNPLSLWLLTKPLSALKDLRPVSVPRLADWLAVLGLTPDARTVYLNYRSALPVTLAGHGWRSASAWLNRFQPPVGGAYLLVATKQGHGFILQRRQQRQQGGELAPAALPNVTRGAHRVP